MRILQISSAESLGGGERHLADLANGLVERGHEVFVALRQNAALNDELGEVAKENTSQPCLGRTRIYPDYPYRPKRTGAV